MATTLQQIWSSNASALEAAMAPVGPLTGDLAYDKVLAAFAYGYANMLAPDDLAYLRNPYFIPVMSTAKTLEEGLHLLDDLEATKVPQKLREHFETLTWLFGALNNDAVVTTLTQAAGILGTVQGKLTPAVLNTLPLDDVSKAEVREFLTQQGRTSTIKNLETSYPDLPTVVDLFMAIPGFDYTTALKLYSRGITTVQRLVEVAASNPEVIKLTHGQQLALQYRDQQPLPLNELNAYYTAISQLIEVESKEANPQVEDWVIGEHRSQNRNATELNLIINQASQRLGYSTIFNVIAKLNPLLLHKLSVSTTKFTGIIQTGDLPPRRLVVKLVSPQAWPFALIWNTGPKVTLDYIVNRAKSAGITFTERGVFNQQGQPITQVPNEDLTTEAGVFHYLKINYVEPRKRA